MISGSDFEEIILQKAWKRLMYHIWIGYKKNLGRGMKWKILFCDIFVNLLTNARNVIF
jgi:hypothetical protein